MNIILSFVNKNKYFLILVALFFLYGFNTILFEGPYGMHIWRQADCVSIADNYLNNGFNFWEPEIHNYISDGKTSGKTAGEFPILYYVIALFWEVFGKSDALYRFVVLAINFTGFLYLFKLLKSLFESEIWAFCITLCFFSCPILLYYGSGFLTNVPAFNLALIGWYHFYRYYKDRKIKFLYFSVLFFVVAGLLKITAFISAIAIFGLLSIELILSFFKRNPRVFHSIYKSLIPFAIGFVLLILWYKTFITYYTDLHTGKYTFNDFWPIWEMDTSTISKAGNFFLNLSSVQFLNPLMWLLFFAGTVVSLFGFKKIGIGYSVLFFGILSGTALYILCWFNALLYHDYYLINLIILPLMAITGLVLFIKKKWSNWYFSKSAKWVLGIVTVFCIGYGSNNIRLRYGDKLTYWKGFGQAFNSDEEIGFWRYEMRNRRGNPVRDLENYIGSIGVGKEDLVICASDPSFCVELYLLNRKGWTNMNVANLEDRIHMLIGKGAKFLIVSDPRDLEKSYLKPFLTKEIGEKNGVKIYKL